MFRPKNDFTTRLRPCELVWLNGEFVAAAHLRRRSFVTQPWHPIVQETVRCFATPRGPALFRTGEHIQQFCADARHVGIDVPFSVEELLAFAHRVVLGNGFDACLLRLIAYVKQPDWLNPRPQSEVMIVPWQQASLLGSGDAALTLPESAALGETPETIFAVRDGVLYKVDGSASGVPHDTVCTLACDAGFAMADQGVTLDGLYTADEAFRYSLLGGMQPLFGDGLTVTSALQQAYQATVGGRGMRSPAWLDYVGMAGLF
jgi:branched-chain amino acid aminotransferase